MASGWKIGDGTTWGRISYDPALDLVYYGVGNPGPWNPEQRPGDNKWTCGMFARRPDTGEAVWAYPMTEAQLRGQQVFLNAQCAKCHNILGVDAYGTLGPDLTHFRSRPTLAAGQLLNTRGNLAGWIMNAPAIKPGTQMPPNQLSGSEMNDLLAYLETLR